MPQRGKVPFSNSMPASSQVSAQQKRDRLFLWHPYEFWASEWLKSWVHAQVNNVTRNGNCKRWWMWWRIWGDSLIGTLKGSLQIIYEWMPGKPSVAFQVHCTIWAAPWPGSDCEPSPSPPQRGRDLGLHLCEPRRPFWWQWENEIYHLDQFLVTLFLFCQAWIRIGSVSKSTL